MVVFISGLTHICAMVFIGLIYITVLQYSKFMDKIDLMVVWEQKHPMCCVKCLIW